jgi:hypothetical protein
MLALMVQSALAATAPLDRAVAFDPLSALCSYEGHGPASDGGEGQHQPGCCTFGCATALRLPAAPASPGVALPQPRLVALWAPLPAQTGPPPVAARLRPSLGARAPPLAA